MAEPLAEPPKMKRCQVIRWFALAGPLFGAWVFLFATAIVAGKPLRVGSTILLGLGLYPTSLVFGFLPALATGALYSQVLKSGMISPESRIQRVLAAVLIGGGAGAFSMSALKMVPGDPTKWEAALSGAVVGGLAAAVCALIWPLPTRPPAI
jgi:hypothetical protein